MAGRQHESSSYAYFGVPSTRRSIVSSAICLRPEAEARRNEVLLETEPSSDRSEAR